VLVGYTNDCTRFTTGVVTPRKSAHRMLSNHQRRITSQQHHDQTQTEKVERDGIAPEFQTFTTGQGHHNLSKGRQDSFARRHGKLEDDAAPQKTCRREFKVSRATDEGNRTTARNTRVHKQRVAQNMCGKTGQRTRQTEQRLETKVCGCGKPSPKTAKNRGSFLVTPHGPFGRYFRRLSVISTSLDR
jgi:hypothetical protein